MSFELTDMEQKYLKRLAALQFSGSRANYSTRHPIHFLEERSADYMPVELSDYDKYEDEIALVEYDEYGDVESFKSVDELVAYHLNIDIDDPDSIERYNNEADKIHEPLFVSYEEATEKYEVPGFDGTVFDLEDYLEVYGLDSSCTRLYRYSDGWDVKAVSFTHRGAEEVREKIDNHIFRPTRYYAFTTTDGDFPVLMGALMKMGAKLLAEESVGVEVTVLKRLDKDQVIAMYDGNPDEEFSLADYAVTLPESVFNPLVCRGGAPHKASLKIMASGHMLTYVSGRYPIGKIRVLYDQVDEDIHKEFVYPFECDPVGESLAKPENVLRLINYARYY